MGTALKTLVLTMSEQWADAAWASEQVRRALCDLPGDISDAAAMAVSELAENAIKYGEAEGASKSAHVCIELRNQLLTLTVSSRLASESAYRTVWSFLNRIAETGAPAELYRARVQEIAAGASDGSRLGLYRIAHEGAFELACHWTDGQLSIIARRQIDGREHSSRVGAQG
jgi:hypothetical protein